jgi:hypothetical protein
VPALAGPGFAQSLWHPSQAAALLGLPAPEGDDPLRAGWDLNAVLTAWIECVRVLAWEQLGRSTPSRGRSLRELSVNVFRPVELLSAAWREGAFLWIVAEDDALVERLDGHARLLAYIEAVQEGWAAFLAATGESIREDREVRSEKGTLPYRALLDAQRLHAAYHLRQLVVFLEDSGVSPASRFRPEQIAGLKLPSAVF